MEQVPKDDDPCLTLSNSYKASATRGGRRVRTHGKLGETGAPSCFSGLGEPEVPDLDEMNGRFAQLLPTKVPDAAMRELAKTMLKVKGAVRRTAVYFHSERN